VRRGLAVEQPPPIVAGRIESAGCSDYDGSQRSQQIGGFMLYWIIIEIHAVVEMSNITI
jgi:hypothetical protein